MRILIFITSLLLFSTTAWSVPVETKSFQVRGKSNQSKPTLVYKNLLQDCHTKVCKDFGKKKKPKMVCSGQTQQPKGPDKRKHLVISSKKRQISCACTCTEIVN